MHKVRMLLSLAVLLLCVQVSAHADTCNGFANNLVYNCSFETGSFSSWSGTSTTNAFSGVDGLAPYSGNYAAYLASNGSTATLTQTLATSAGFNYLIQFALQNDTSPSLGYTNSFATLFGGSTIFSETAVLAGNYTLYSFLASANSTSTALSFVSRNDGGTFALDSISVTAATPEPSTWVLLGTGVLSMGGVIRRRLTA